jgi:hypothetical protein
MDRLVAQAEEVVAAHPIRGLFVVDTTLTAAQAEADETGSFGWVVTLPLLPFRALSGVSESGQAISKFNVTAQRLADIVNALPEITRLELELLLYDVEDLETVEAFLTGWASLADSARSLSAAVEALPDEILGRIDASQSDLRETLKAAREAFTEAERTVQAIREATGPFAAMAERMSVAGDAWDRAFSEIRAMQDSAAEGGETQAGEEARPFDIRDYQATARELSRAAVELRGLALDARSLMDDATWRVLQILVAFFALLAGYVIVATLVRRASRRPSRPRA